MSRPVETVLLDAGGVLLLQEHALVLEALAGIGRVIDPDRIDRAHYAAVAVLDAGPAARDPWDSYRDAYVRALGIPNPEVPRALQAVFSTPGRWTRVAPGSREGLRVLAATGARLAIVSNSDGSVEAQLRALELCQCGPGPGITVSTVVDSTVVGVAKPDPRIFEIAVQATGSQPERTVHVGDSVRIDVDGARAAGIQGLHFDPFGLCAGEGHDHLRSLTDLAPMIARFG